MLGSSLWLGPQILRQNPANSVAVFVARTSLCWLMVTTKFCGTSRAANVFPATNVWLWGECHESSRSGATTGENIEGAFGRERQQVPIFRERPCRRDWCIGPESWGYGESFLPHWSATSGRKLWAGSGCSLLCLLSVSTWMLRSHVTRSWLQNFRPIFCCVHPRVHPICCLFWSIILDGKYPQVLSRCINWARSHGSFSVEFEEHGDEVRVFLRTWDIHIFRRICVATLDRYSSNPHQEIETSDGIVDALGPDLLLVSISRGSTLLMEAFCEYLGSRYRQKLMDYPSFDLRSFKRCLQLTASSVIGSLAGLAMTELIVNRLKGAETRAWVSSRHSLRKFILTTDLGMPHLVDVVANVIGVRPLIVS